MPVVTRLLGLIAASCLAACASTEVPPAGATLAITNVRVVDVEAGRSTPGRTVWLAGDRIAAVTRGGRPPAGVGVLDGAGGYLIPGLWDMHAHALSDPDDAVRRALPLFIAHGVTGIRDMGSLVPAIVETRRRLAASPASPAPRLYVSGPLLDGLKLPWYGELPLVLKTREEVRTQLPALRAAGVDFFKMYDNLGPEASAEVRALASEWGLPVAGHAPRASGLKGAAAAGFRTVEHLTPATFSDCAPEPDKTFGRWINSKFGDKGWTEYYKVSAEWLAARDPVCSAESHRAMAAAGTFFTPTLVMEFGDRSRVDKAALRYMPAKNLEWCRTTLGQADASDVGRRDALYAAYARTLTDMRKSGVRSLAGSDSANNCLVAGASLVWELERLVEVGFTPAEALAAATTSAAAALGRADTQGRVAPGQIADLVLLREDPLADIKAVRAVQAVVSQGRVHRREVLDAMLAQAADAAAASLPPVPATAAAAKP
jgi:imidazolonepropionase-like amidohydrolase